MYFLFQMEYDEAFDMYDYRFEEEDFYGENPPPKNTATPVKRRVTFNNKRFIAKVRV